MRVPQVAHSHACRRSAQLSAFGAACALLLAAGCGGADSGSSLDASSAVDSGSTLDASSSADGGSKPDASTGADSGSGFDTGVPGSRAPGCYTFTAPETCPANCSPIYRRMPDGGMSVFCSESPLLVSCDDAGISTDAGDLNDGGCVCIPIYSACGYGNPHSCCPLGLGACNGSGVCIVPAGP